MKFLFTPSQSRMFNAFETVITRYGLSFTVSNTSIASKPFRYLTVLYGSTLALYVTDPADEIEFEFHYSTTNSEIIILDNCPKRVLEELRGRIFDLADERDRTYLLSMVNF